MTLPRILVAFLASLASAAAAACTEHAERARTARLSLPPAATVAPPYWAGAALSGSWYDAARDRPRSATVFNLGYDLAEAARYPYVAKLTGAPPRDRPPMAGEQDASQTAATDLFMPRRQARS